MRGRRKEPAGPLDYSRKLWIRLIIGFVLVFLYLPIITLVVFSFNDSRRNIVWNGFTFDYYVKAANNWPFGAALSFLLLYATFGALALRSLAASRRGASL